MSELPPDPARLHAILAHLDKQLADNETVGIYLRLQRDAVRAALARADDPPPRRPRRLPKGGAGLGPMAQMQPRPQFVVQQKRTPRGPEPAIIHVGDCTMIEGTPHRITEHDARVSLMDPNIEACAFCRPDTELGIME
ncbi:DUF6233 domain-containing protein [Streptomyces sp. NPDC050211]|uniref:DUF6233 domain-containing protein n=1 Tax=Streptomyces sp. NPDC050211 TaxID=3154932 RepID=UPI0034449D7B